MIHLLATVSPRGRGEDLTRGPPAHLGLQVGVQQHVAIQVNGEDVAIGAQLWGDRRRGELCQAVLSPCHPQARPLQAPSLPQSSFSFSNPRSSAPLFVEPWNGKHAGATESSDFLLSLTLWILYSGLLPIVFAIGSAQCLQVPHACHHRRGGFAALLEVPTPCSVLQRGTNTLR